MKDNNPENINQKIYERISIKSIENEKPSDPVEEQDRCIVCGKSSHHQCLWNKDDETLINHIF